MDKMSLKTSRQNGTRFGEIRFHILYISIVHIFQGSKKTTTRIKLKLGIDITFLCSTLGSLCSSLGFVALLAVDGVDEAAVGTLPEAAWVSCLHTRVNELYGHL